MLKIRVEMNERETKHRKDQQSKIWFIEKTSKIDSTWFLRRCTALGWKKHKLE